MNILIQNRHFYAKSTFLTKSQHFGQRWVKIDNIESFVLKLTDNREC